MGPAGKTALSRVTVKFPCLLLTGGALGEVEANVRQAEEETD